MKTAEEIAIEHTIKYGGIDYIDLDATIEAMKEYAKQALKHASLNAKVKVVDYGCFGIHAYEYEIDKESILNTPLI